MRKLVDINDVIKVVDRHTKNESEIVLDNDITCILEEVQIVYDIDEIIKNLEHLAVELQNNENIIKVVPLNMVINLLNDNNIKRISWWLQKEDSIWKLNYQN